MRKRENSLNVFRNRGCRALLLSIVVIGISFICGPQKSFAVLGSDWHIKTPGGNAIYGGDRCEGLSSICLTDGKASTIYAHHLRRWRYYTDYIIGEQEEGFFIFHEPSGTFQHFAEKSAWKDACRPIRRWLPRSGWITRDHGSLGLDWLPRLFGHFITLGIGACLGLCLLSLFIRQVLMKRLPAGKSEHRNGSVVSPPHSGRPAGITVITALYLAIGGLTFLPAVWMFLFFPFTPGLGNILASTLALTGGIGIALRKTWGWWTGALYAVLMPGLYIVTPLRNLAFIDYYYSLLSDGMLYTVLIFIGHILLAIYVFKGPVAEYCRVHSSKPSTRFLMVCGGALGLSVLCNFRPLAQSPDRLLIMAVKFLVGILCTISTWELMSGTVTKMIHATRRRNTMITTRDVRPILSRQRRWRMLLLGVCAFSLGLLCVPQKSCAVMGSDWHVKTPGGNAIYGGDRCDGYGGVCLTDSRASTVYVSYIHRWRYYHDYVIGEQEQGWFIFHESTRQVQNFSDDKQWQNTLNDLQLGKPKSAWLTPKDGWWRGGGLWLVLIILGYLVVIGVGFSVLYWFTLFTIHKVIACVKNRH
jgi:hypothetical protein